MVSHHSDVLILGAGPAGAVAAALLVRRGYSVTVLEREMFPRFSIGESLLPQCMAFLEEAGMLPAVQAIAASAGFQFKNGAAFAWRDARAEFDFTDKFSPGWGTTWQVCRADFDQALARSAQEQGAEIRFGHSVCAVDVSDASRPCVVARLPDGSEARFSARFMLDASGYGRVLSRLLHLETPSNFPVRQAIFSHVRDAIPADSDFDRNKIRVGIHPELADVWYWLIPFSDGRCSMGVVGSQARLAAGPQGDLSEQLWAWVGAEPGMAALLGQAQLLMPARTLIGYSANVTSLVGPGYALLGNAGEFLDPVFSSGVTVAMKSASLAAEVLHRQFKGERVDWQTEFAAPLKKGVRAFRSYVEGWYDGSFQDVIFHPAPHPGFKRMIAAVLAGYAWDEQNPFVCDSQKRLAQLASLSPAVLRPRVA